MSEPSVKGTLVQSAVSELRRLEERGSVSRAALECDLKREDLELLDEEILVSGWYPMASYGRMLEAIAAVLGQSGDADFVETGRQSARRLVEMGLYRQLDERTAERWEERVGKLLLSVASLLWNFGSWEWLGMDESGFRIRFQGASPMPRSYALRTQGVVEHLAARAAGSPVRVQLTRSADGDTLEFRCRKRL
jgi:hypothetical protein